MRCLPLCVGSCYCHTQPGHNSPTSKFSEVGCIGSSDYWPIIHAIRCLRGNSSLRVTCAGLFWSSRDAEVARIQLKDLNLELGLDVVLSAEQTCLERGNERVLAELEEH
jgi:hypothetical protein